MAVVPLEGDGGETVNGYRLETLKVSWSLMVEMVTQRSTAQGES